MNWNNANGLSHPGDLINKTNCNVQDELSSNWTKEISTWSSINIQVTINMCHFLSELLQKSDDYDYY